MLTAIKRPLSHVVALAVEVRRALELPKLVYAGICSKQAVTKGFRHLEKTLST